MKNLFILGNPRSGTSLLRIMLNCHKDITVPPECGFIQWWSKKYKNWNVQNSLNSDYVDDFINDLRSSKKIETWDLSFPRVKKLILSKKPVNYSSLSSLVIYQYGIQAGKDPLFLGDKNNYYLEHLNLLEELYGNAYFIGIVRDGRDVACSYLEVNKLEDESPYKPKLTNEIEEIALEWRENNINLWNFCNKEKNNKRCIIRFEDLILNTKETLYQLTNFMGLRFDPTMLDYYLQSEKRFLEPKSILGWKRKITEAPDVSKIGRYNRDLSIEKQKLFYQLSGDTLRLFDYT